MQSRKEMHLLETKIRFIRIIKYTNWVNNFYKQSPKLAIIKINPIS